MKNLHYGWVMVILAASFLMLHALVIFTFGIFLLPLTMEFGWDRGALSGAFSVFCIIIGICSIFAGRLTDKYGPRYLITAYGVLIGIGFLLMSQIDSLWQIYVVWGVLMGIGASCSVVPAASTIPRWFVRRRGIALGITWAGFGFGSIIWPPITQWLISTYGWQQSFIILGLINIIIAVPLAQFMKHSPQRVGLKPYGEYGTMEDKQTPSSARGGLSFDQAFRTGPFWMFGIMQLCFYFYLQIATVHLVPLAVDAGISAIIAASIVSIVGMVSIMGRLSIGFISDRIGSKPALNGCFILSIVALVWLLFARGTWMFYGFGVIFGFAYGCMIPLQTSVPSELFGLRSLGTILGTFWLLSMLGSAIGAPLAGRIFDITGSYGLAILISIMVCVLAIILGFILIRSRFKMDVTASG